MSTAMRNQMYFQKLFCISRHRFTWLSLFFFFPSFVSPCLSQDNSDAIHLVQRENAFALNGMQEALAVISCSIITRQADLISKSITFSLGLSKLLFDFFPFLTLNCYLAMFGLGSKFLSSKAGLSIIKTGTTTQASCSLARSRLHSVRSGSGQPYLDQQYHLVKPPRLISPVRF